MRNLVLIGCQCLPIMAVSANNQDSLADQALAVKLEVDYSSLQGIELNRGGGYDLLHSKIKLGNFLASLSHERFAVKWKKQDDLPFANGHTNPLAHVERYHLEVNIPYRLNDKQMWLGHIGAEWAYEKQQDKALSLQGYLLYSDKWGAESTWQLGAYLNYHPVETVVLPIVEYTYNYPFKNKSGYYGHLGFPKTQLGYFLNPKLRTDIGFVYHQATVQLAQNSVIEAGGFFQSKNWRANWQTYYAVNKQLEVRFGLDLSVSNKLVLHDSRYKKVAHHYADNGAGMHLGISYQF